jgi:hypothetical protein
MGWGVYKLFVVKQWVEDVEYEGNVDADKALEDLNGEEGEDKKDGGEEKVGNGKDGKKEKGAKK